MKKNKRIEFENGSLLEILNSVQGATRSGTKLILHSEDGVEARTMWKGIEVLVIPIEGGQKSELPFKDDVSFISPAFQKPVRIVRNNIIFEDEEESY